MSDLKRELPLCHLASEWPVDAASAVWASHRREEQYLSIN
jgi:hypothetical protein